MKLAITALLLCLLVASCKKNTSGKENIPKETGTVTIDSIRIHGLDKIIFTASLHQFDTTTLIEKGVCWSQHQNPTIYDSVKWYGVNRSFNDTIINMGHNTQLFFRAFARTGNGFIYSDPAQITTNSLNLKWERTYNNGKLRSIVKAIQTDDGGFLALVKVFGTSVAWPGLIKMDSAGTVTWDNEYNPGQGKEARYVQKLTDGYAFAGTYHYTGGRSVFITKVDLNGNKLWERNFTSQRAYQDITRITSLANGNLLITTREFDDIVNSVRTNPFISEFIVSSSTGNIVSQNAVPDSPSNYLLSAWSQGISLSNNDYVTGSNGSPGMDIVLQRFNSANQLSWENVFGGNKDDYLIDIATSPNGNLAVLASTTSYGTTKQSAWLIGADHNNGSKLWEFLYDNSKYGTQIYTYPQAVSSNNNGEYYITGAVNGYLGRPPSALLLKVDANHQLLWDHVYINPAGFNTSSGSAVLTKSNNEIYVFGERIQNQQANWNELFLTKFKVE